MSIAHLEARRSFTSPADVDWFWGLIEASRGPDEPKQLELLADSLLSLDDRDLVDFIALFDGVMSAMNSARLRAAAYLMNGGCSDDGFVDFRYWLISRGRAVATLGMTDPDALARFEVEIETASFEWFGAVMRDEYAARSGGVDAPRVGDLPSAERDSERPFDHDEPEMRRRLPQLAARYLG